MFNVNGNEILDSFSNLVYVMDNQYKVIYINRSAKKALENDCIFSSIDKLSQLMSYYKFTSEEDDNDLTVELFINKIKQDAEDLKYAIVRCYKDDNERYLKIKMNSLLINEFTSVYILTIENITQNYLMEKQLIKERENFISISTELKAKCNIIEVLRNREKEHLKHLKDVINNISEGILVLDNRGNFNFCNPATYSILNTTPGDLIYYANIDKKYEIEDLESRKVNISDLFKCKENAKNIVLSLRRQNSDWHKYIEFNINPIYNKMKEELYTIITLKDVTKSVEHNIELENLTKMKDEFFTLMSHELRTPLTLIHSSLQLAYGVYGEEITTNIDRTFTRINQNCSRLLKLINNILDISKAEAGFLTVINTKFEVVSTTEMIVNSINNFAISRNIGIVFDTNEEEAYVSLDKDKYEKILLNILSNAIKFTPDEKKIFVTLQIEKQNIILTVRDEGVGIPNNKLESIFDRFAQVNSSLSRRAEGTGLGLALVKKLVDLMDGTIAVKSKIDEGTEFIIFFNKCITINDRESDALTYNEDMIKNYSMVDANISDKINIEFSDID